MPEDFATREFRPDSRGFLMTQGAIASLGIAGWLTASSGSPSAYLWVCLALASLATLLALRSIRLLVTSDNIVLRLCGFTRTYPINQIDSIRLNELAFLDLFQISLHNGGFMLIPRKAFTDSAPFAAMDALISKYNDKDAVIAERPKSSGARKETL